MKVSELKQILNDYPDDIEVILAKDEEGNLLSPCSDVETYLYVPVTSYYGEIYPTPENITANPDHYDEEDICDDPNAQRALVLWPSN